MDKGVCLVKAECSNTCNETLLDIVQGLSEAVAEPVLVKRDHFHCTLLYSRGYTTAPRTFATSYTATVVDVCKMSDGKAVAALLDCQSLCERRQELLLEAGGREDYEYIPHITLGYQTEPVSEQQILVLLCKLRGLTVVLDYETCKCS